MYHDSHTLYTKGLIFFCIYFRVELYLIVYIKHDFLDKGVDEHLQYFNFHMLSEYYKYRNH